MARARIGSTIGVSRGRVFALVAMLSLPLAACEAPSREDEEIGDVSQLSSGASPAAQDARALRQPPAGEPAAGPQRYDSDVTPKPANEDSDGRRVTAAEATQECEKLAAELQAECEERIRTGLRRRAMEESGSPIVDGEDPSADERAGEDDRDR